MLSIIFFSAFSNLAFTIAAVVVLVLVLRGLDKLAGFHFREWLHDADDLSKSIYFGARIIAAALIIGMVVSVPI